jgi:hypothetical protein
VLPLTVPVIGFLGTSISDRRLYFNSLLFVKARVLLGVIYHMLLGWAGYSAGKHIPSFFFHFKTSICRF